MQEVRVEMIAIVDYGMGNVGSILNMLGKVGVRATVTANPEVLASASAIILPGVGTFDAGMERLERLDLKKVLDHQALVARKPILGICLGMQLLTRRSDEGQKTGLGWIDAETLSLRGRSGIERLKVPQMGWNQIKRETPHPLFLGLDDARYYFVHSYYVQCDHSADVIASADYGGSFAASIGRDNIVGTQFHPEKSHKFGLQLMRNFAEWTSHVQSPRDSLSAA